MCAKGRFVRDEGGGPCNHDGWAAESTSKRRSRWILQTDRIESPQEKGYCCDSKARIGENKTKS